MAVEKGNKVKVEYKGTFDDGTVFDASEKHGQPLEFTAGAGQVVKGFDDAVMGMNVDESKTFKVKPEEGYGEHKADLIKKIPRKDLPEGEEPKVGMMVGLTAPNGQQFPAMITEVSDEEITIDLNHPLAGKQLTFEIKVVGIEDAA